MELRKAIVDKLQSSLKLGQKCTLAKNVFLSNSVKIAQKEEMILNWAVTTLLKKFSANMDDAKDGELWSLLVALSSSPKFEANFLAACHDNLWDFLNTVVDHFSLCQDRDLIGEFLSALIRRFRHVRSALFKKPDELNLFIGKCLDNDAIVSDVLWLYALAIQHSSLGSNFFEVLLPKLLTLEGHKEDAIKLVCHGLFSKDKSSIWSAFLRSIINQPSDETKPKSGETLEKLFMKLSSMSHAHQLSALLAIFAASIKSRTMTEQSKALVFIMGCDILQFYPTSEEIVKLSPLASSVVLPKFKMSVHDRVGCLERMTASLVEAKFDLTTNLQPNEEGSTLLKFLQHLLKHLLSSCLDDIGIVSTMAVHLANYSPMVIEPLVGSLSVAIMGIENDELKTALMCQVITLFHKLRQLPKLVARLLISVGKMDQVIVWNASILECFADKVAMLPSGQLLELWKTFEYHMKAASNSHAAIEALMPVFLLHACLVDQSIPDPTMTKVLASIKSSQDLCRNFPKVAKALAEVCIMLRHTRGLDLGPISSLTRLQKRKLESIQEEGEKKGVKQAKMDLTWDDIKDEFAGAWKAVLPYFQQEEAEKGLLDILKSCSSLRNLKVLFEESSTAQTVLIINIILDGLIAENKKSKFLTCLRGGDTNEAALELWNIGEFKIPGENELFAYLQLLPLDHLQGALEISTGLLLLSLMRSQAKFAELLARLCQGIFRPSSILKYVSVTKVLDFVAAVDNRYVWHILQSLTKVGVMYQKPLDEIIGHQDEFTSPLETLADEAKVQVSVSLMESLHPLLTLRSVNEDKKAKCERLFKALSKAFQKGLKNEDNNLDPMLITRALTPVVDVIAKDDAETKKTIKKWACHLAKYIPYCMASLNDEVSVKFLHAVLANFSLISEKMAMDKFLEDFSASKLTSEPIQDDERKSLLQLLFEVTSAHDMEIFQKLLRNLAEASVSNFPSLDIYSNWKILVQAKIHTDAFTLRREAIEKILPLMTSANVPVNEANLKHYYLPTLDFQASLLGSEKPILYKESEAFCVATCVTLKLDQELLAQHPHLFEQLWMAIHKVISTAFHKRPSSLVVSRIPLIIAGIRNLLHGLAIASDQKRGLEANEIKAMTHLAHNFDRLCDHMKKLKDEFARVAPYLIGDIMESLQKVTMYPNARANVLFGVHKLLDICDSHSSDFLSGVLPPGQQEMFKHVYANYRSYHKYSGKV